MIDVHFHCLPGIDDGPADWQEAEALCREAFRQGCGTLVATPHVLRAPWINGDPAVRDSLVAELNRRLGGRPRILPGCEYLYAADVVERWEEGRAGPLTGLGGRAVLLVEFGADAAWRDAAVAVHELSILGVTVVVAHPERHPLFSADAEALAALVERGAKLQITAGSVTGDFGERRRAACDEMFRRNLVHFVGSDAHSLAHRPPRLRAARDRVAAEWGSERAEEIFDRNPRELIGEPPAR